VEEHRRYRSHERNDGFGKWRGVDEKKRKEGRGWMEEVRGVSGVLIEFLSRLVLI